MKSAGTVSISVALRSLTVAALGLALMFHTSVVLTVLTLAVLPLMLIAFQVYARFNRHYTSQSLTSSAQASVVAEECFGSIRTVRLPVSTPACACACVANANAWYCISRSSSHGVQCNVGIPSQNLTKALIVQLWAGACKAMRWRNRRCGL